MGQTVVELDEVTRRYGDFIAVDRLSFTVEKGSIFGFLGPNGAGKTSTLRMILDIIQPSAGRLRVLDADSAVSVRHRIGYLPEERGLYKKMTATQAITYFGKLKGLWHGEARRRAVALLERFGLSPFADSKIEALSRGMAQKVQVLSAIVHEPDLVILDEPFSGLDPVNQIALEELILELKAEGRTVIFSTHVMQHAERLCDKLLLIARGRQAFLGTLEEARAVIPRKVRLETPDDVAPLRGLDAVETLVPAGDPDHPDRWDVVLRQGADPQTILKACFDARIRLSHLDQSDPTLHDVFVHLVGPEAVAGPEQMQETRP